MSNTCSYQI